MFPVCMFLTRTTVITCIGEAPQYWDIIDLGIYVGNFFPSCSIGSITYEGYTHERYFCRALWEDLDLVQTTYGYIPLVMWEVGLCTWTTWAIVMGKRFFSLASVQLHVAWIIMVMNIITKLLIELSDTPLWCWPTTPLCLITWPLPCRSLVNSLGV